MSQEMSSKVEEETTKDDDLIGKEVEEWVNIIIMNEEDDKEEEDFKMSDDLRTTCEHGPLGELREKINSSNINSKDEVR